MSSRVYIPVDSTSFPNALDISGDVALLNTDAVKFLVSNSINGEVGSDYAVGSDNISVNELFGNIRTILHSGSMDDAMSQMDDAMVSAGRVTGIRQKILSKFESSISVDDFDLPGDLDNHIAISGISISGNRRNLYDDLSDKIVDDELMEEVDIMIDISLETNLTANIRVDLSSDSVLKSILDTSLGEIVGESSVVELITNDSLPIGKTSYASDTGSMNVLGDTLSIPVTIISVESGNGLSFV